MAKNTMKELTHGSPMKLILTFVIPLIFGNLFQQFYGMVDTMVVGRYLGVNALAAVGSTGSISYLIIGFCSGVCTGFAIPVGQKFGARDYASLRRFVANSVWLSVIFAIVATIGTVSACRGILELMKTPADIIDGAYTYVAIIFLGIPVTFLYNLLAGIIRALGDSKTPVYFLMVSATLNIILDLVFVLAFDMGIAGVAWATVISQGVSGILCLFYMKKKFDILKMSREEWRADSHLMKILCNMAIPTGLQHSVTALGGVIVQSAVNGLGAITVAAITASNRVSALVNCPFDALGVTMTNYASQNVGANEMDRVKKGVNAGNVIAFVYSIIAILLVHFIGRPFITLFITTTDVGATDIVNLAFKYLTIYTYFGMCLAWIYIYRFSIQGMGFPKYAVIAGALEMVARVIMGIFLIPRFGFDAACFSNPMAWIFTDIFLFPAFYHLIRKLKVMYGNTDNA